MIKRNYLKSIIVRLVLLGSVLGACNLPSAEGEGQGEEAAVGVKQEEVSSQNEQPFEQLTPEEFFAMCEEDGGQVEQWGSSWACDFETEKDITCNGAGECNYGTVPEIVTAGYSIKQPVLSPEDDPGRFVERCSEAGGVFFEWHAGFGCDFEDQMDVFCVPEEDGECGLGWVTELTELIPEEEVETPAEGEGGGLVLVAQVLSPAFQQDAVMDADQPPGDPGNEFVLAKQFFATDIFTAMAFRVGIEADKDETDDDKEKLKENVAKEDDSEEGDEEEDDVEDVAGTFDDLVGTGEDCELAGGSSTIEIDPDESGANYDVMVCTFPGGDGYWCSLSACASFFVGEQPDGSLDFGNFQEAFVATQVFIVLTGPSDIDQGFLDPAQPGNDLFVAVFEKNGIVGWVEGQTGVYAPINLPGTVSVIGPNHVVFPSEGPQELLLIPIPSGNPLKKDCLPIDPLCWPGRPGVPGLLIPAETLVYFVSVSDLGMPDKFNWVEKLKPTPTGPVIKVAVTVTPLTPVFKSTAIPVTPSPTAKNTKVPMTNKPPTVIPVPISPTPDDPMNAQISGFVWNDANGNEVVNSGEGALAQTTIKLGAGACNSTGLGNIITNITGTYSFLGLAAGTYCVSATRTSSPTSGTTPTFVTVVLSPGQSITINFGFQNVID